MTENKPIIDGVDVICEYCKNCYELAEQLHRYKQVVKEIKDIVIDFENSYGTGYKEIDKIIQKCEEVNK